MRFIAFGCAVAVALFAGPATASQSGWYAGGMVGLTILHDSDNAFSGGGTTRTEYDVGAGFGAVGGWDFGNNIRAELELSYRISGADRQLPGAIALDGTTSALALMANGYYDFYLGDWVPYAGFGLGFARIASDIDSGGVKIVDDSDVVFAYQFIGGVGYTLTPQVTLTLDYRIFGTSDPELTNTSNVKFDAEYFTQNIMLGARYRF